MADGTPVQSRTRKKKLCADLWCGAGGLSTGMARAMRELELPFSLASVNHWPTAIETHCRNHPEHAARTYCADLEVVRPISVVPEGYLDLLAAAPTCTFHSRARGGKPVNDQQRMDPWHVVRWCTELRVKRLLVENVPEIMDWGPCSLVTGRPIPSRKGEYFRAWIDALKAIGFRIDFRVLCAADYGDPTTRQRFFLIGRTDRGPLRWPSPGYSKAGTDDLLDVRARWRGAVEIIDWTLPGKSIFTRKTPLKPNTIRRILAGAKRYHWPVAYQDALQALLDGREPVLNLSRADWQGTGDGHRQALVMACGSGGIARDITQPLPTITAGGDADFRPHFIESLLTSYYGFGTTGTVDDPLPTVTTKDRFGLAEPVVLSTSNSSSPGIPRSVEDPLRTITTAKGGDMAVASPIIMRGNVGTGREGDMRSAERPLPTITCSESLALAAPFVLPVTHHGDERTHDIDGPLPTITGANRGELGLAQPAADGYRIDILYRMLNYRELARGMSLDDEGSVYDFAGTSTEITKQIGNAVPCRLAKALVRALMEES